MFQQWLDKGIAIAGIDVGESYGSPKGRRLYSALHQQLVEQWKLGDKPCLLGRSRGGLMLYNWAVENPGKVSGIAGVQHLQLSRTEAGLWCLWHERGRIGSEARRT